MVRRLRKRYRALERPSRNVVLGIVVFALAIVAAVWTTALVIVVHERAAVYADAEAELVGGQKTIAAHIGRTFESALTLLAAVDQWLVERSGASPPRRLETLGVVIEQVQRYSERPLTLRLLDEAGNLQNLRPSSPPISMAEREYFKGIHGKPPGAFYIGVPFQSRLTDDRVMPIVMAARPNAYGIAYIGTAIPVEPLEDAYRALLITAPAISGIVRSDGTMLFRHPDPGSQVGKQFAAFEFDTFFGQQPPVGVLRNMSIVTGTPRLVAYRKLDNLPLASYSGFDMADLDARAWQRSIVPLTAAAIASLATLAVTIWLIALVVQREVAARRIRGALADAERSNRAKTDFLANMSHELRTPLNAILGFSEMIRSSMAGPVTPKYRDYATDINNSGQHLLGVIEQILDVAKIEKGAIMPADEIVDIQHVLGETASMLAPRFAAGHVQLIRNLPPEFPLLRADTRMLRQMLLNLLSNAARYAGNGARVTVSAAVNAGVVTLTVTDNGPGIPTEVLKHIFEPFGRSHSTVARKDGGLGLGLPITKSLVELHGGAIVIDSKPGAGTAVTLNFAPDRLVLAAKKSA